MARDVEGEAAHSKGRDGVRRAKLWLDSTSRVDAQWVNPDVGAKEKLTCDWPQGGQGFSFDLGGLMRYGDYDGQMFFAEVKMYASTSDLGSHYVEFLAKCYVMFLDRPQFSDHFMWISWVPHNISKWASLTSAAEVRAAVVANARRIFSSGVDPDQSIDDSVCQQVADRLWLLILSENQEKLVPSTGHLALIHKAEFEKRSAS